MAIQIPNLGSGDGLTGDNELVIRQKYNANFTDATHAASKLVGTAAGQIPLAQDTFKAAHNKTNGYITGGVNTQADGFAAGTRYLVTSAMAHPELHALLNDDHYYIETIVSFEQSGLAYIQTALPYRRGGGGASRIKAVGDAGAWSSWISHTTVASTYSTTTASGANVVVDSTGKLMRSTSSERYKDILAPLVLDDAKYADAMSLKPIVYRSTADADNPLHHYYSFSAEELGAYDPAFTLWRTTEMVTDAEGVTTEQPLTERQAEGININALLAMNHAIAIKQDKMIKAQAAAIATLTQRIDTITA